MFPKFNQVIYTLNTICDPNIMILAHTVLEIFCSQAFIGWKCNKNENQRTNGPVSAHLISWPIKAQNIQNLENIW